MTSKYIGYAALILYTLLFLYTYGHSFHRIDCGDTPIQYCTEKKATGAFLAAFFTPFYWSVHITNLEEQTNNDR